ncbi:MULTISPECIES: SH3 domain-containing protein [unclassified Chryseobacterium]|uniref:SH3 domain-containing protein n=1 Tax=unclassified Chryseobacterium TaxID=2593645 RepID=UPI002882D5BA|nr:SH3 domain-containing protein [Chryseobacterium sp. SG20098]WNI38860.1 SH3 domain-containing protein [Chryseobacterium sp. SG20098]
MKNLNNLENLRKLSTFTEQLNSIVSSPLMEVTRKLNAYGNSTILDEFNKSTKIVLTPSIYDLVRKFDRISNEPTLAAMKSINTQLLDNEILKKINSIGYWAQVASILVNETIQIPNSEEIEILAQELANHAEELDESSLEIFNNLVISIKNYIVSNPSIKYSGLFILFLIQQILVPIILEKIKGESQNSPTTVQIINNYNNNNILAKANQKCSIRNYPKNSSKEIFILQENDQVEILKDNIKWCLVIKTNTAETGWIRKEYLNFSR